MSSFHHISNKCFDLRQRFGRLRSVAHTGHCTIGLTAAFTAVSALLMLLF